MNLEVILTPLITALVAAFVLAGASNTRSWARVGVSALCAGLLVLAVMLWMLAGPSPYPLEESKIANRPIELPTEGYVSSDTCQSCHPQEYDSWRRSHHSTMTQVATPETVLPDFNVELQNRYNYRLEQRGDEFWVDSDNPALGTHGHGRTQRRVVMSTGSHHHQIFWVETDHDRKIELLPFLWFIREQRWVPFVSVFLQTETEKTGESSWDVSCIRCHVTHGRSRLRAPPPKADTHVSELGIACESCHGPAEEHVALNRDPVRRYGLHLSQDAADPSIVHPEKLSHDRSSEVCGQCHSAHSSFNLEQRLHWLQNGMAYRPGDVLADSKNLLSNQGEQIPFVEGIMQGNRRFLENTFWPDGEAAISGREYHGLIESPCYAGGDFSCFSCHTMHQAPDDPRPSIDWQDDQLTLGKAGDGACLQCHESMAEQIGQHTHHAAGSSGSECQNCHMPNTAYGLLKTTRSHKITNPSVAISLETGRPNACNLCHLDKTLVFTAEAQQEWWGTPVPELSQDEREVAASLLWLLRGHAGQRAVVAWAMAWEPARQTSGTDWMTPFLARLLDDPYVAIRYLSEDALQGLPGYDADVDPFGPVAVLTQARWSTEEKWSRLQRVGQASSATLVDQKGVLDARRFEHLFSQRDNRPIFRPE